MPGLILAYQTLRRLFEATWYGHRETPCELAQTFREQVRQAMEVRA